MVQRVEELVTVTGDSFEDESFGLATNNIFTMETFEVRAIQLQKLIVPLLTHEVTRPLWIGRSAPSSQISSLTNLQTDYTSCK